MTTISFFAPGIPKAQPRMRPFSAGGRARVYTPGTAEAWKQAVFMAFTEAKADGDGALPLSGPVSLSIAFIFPRPKNHYRTGKHAAELKPDAPDRHFIKPDMDNLEKAVMDALTIAGAWHDDCQVARRSSEKWYACDHEDRPGASITIGTLQPRIER